VFSVKVRRHGRQAYLLAASMIAAVTFGGGLLADEQGGMSLTLSALSEFPNSAVGVVWEGLRLRATTLRHRQEAGPRCFSCLRWHEACRLAQEFGYELTPVRETCYEPGREAEAKPACCRIGWTGSVIPP